MATGEGNEPSKLSPELEAEIDAFIARFPDTARGMSRVQIGRFLMAGEDDFKLLDEATGEWKRL